MDEHKLWGIQNEAYMRGYEDGRKHVLESVRADINERLEMDLQGNAGAKKRETLSGSTGEKNGHRD